MTRQDLNRDLLTMAAAIHAKLRKCSVDKAKVMSAMNAQLDAWLASKDAHTIREIVGLWSLDEQREVFDQLHALGCTYQGLSRLDDLYELMVLVFVRGCLIRDIKKSIMAHAS